MFCDLIDVIAQDPERSRSSINAGFPFYLGTWGTGVGENL